MRPNLFDYATSELSQDAFLLWFLRWADPIYKDEDLSLHQCSCLFVNRLLGLDDSLEISTIKVEKQVVILYALTRGFLDDIPVADITRFENELFSWLDSNHTGVLDHIRTTKDLPADADLAEAINAFKKTFAKSE